MKVNKPSVDSDEPKKHWLCTVRLPNAFREKLDTRAAEKSSELRVRVTRSDMVRMILEKDLGS